MTGQRIAILLPNLRSGGAERLHVDLAREWVSLGLSVDFVLRMADGVLLEALPDGCRVVDLHARRVRNAIIPLARYLKVSKPDALLAPMWPNSAIAPIVAKAVGFKGRVVSSEHAPQSVASSKKGVAHHFAMVASMRLGYRLASAIVGVSRGVAADAAQLAGMQSRSIKVIYNPAARGVQMDRAGWSLPIEKNGPLILSVGTLKQVKRFDLLIRAFAQVQDIRTRLCIVGEGSEKARLMDLATSLGVAERVSFPGFQRDPTSWYSHSDLFVLCSDYEGFGNVIVEALEQGTPVVCTDCPFGPREILDNGRYGELVPVGDVDALSAAMESSLKRSHDSSLLRRRASDFRVGHAARAYLEILVPDWQHRQP